MTHRRSALILVALAAWCAEPALLACGDKFLVAGRGARFKRGKSHSLAVLIYAPPASSLGASGRTASFDKTLRRAGYHPSVAASPEELGKAFGTAAPGLVLADIRDAGDVGKLAPEGASAPAFIPVLARASGSDLAEARKTWGVALKADASGDSLLDAVEEAVERRAKERARTDASP